MTEVTRKVDLGAEQERSLQRPRMTYSPLAKLLFFSLDLLYGRATTLPKVRMLEILARIPYQAWEKRQYVRLSRIYTREQDVERAVEIQNWGRAAQDNEFWHLRVIDRKMRLEGVREAWLFESVAPVIADFKYRLFCRFLARFHIERAFLMNAEFEDHAEHAYMAFVAEHPEWDRQRVEDPLVRRYAEAATWGDVFRHIGLDERDHMNDSLAFCGMSDRIAPYAPGAISSEADRTEYE